MENQFTLSCCSTVDLPYAYMASRHIPVLFYTYVVDGTEYDDDMGRDPAALPRFYGFIRQGKLPQTSQINVAAYMDFFEKLLQTGDVLHIAFTSGQSGSVHNAFLAAEELRKKYPDRKLVVIDSLCSSSGYGLLVDCAADLRDEGKSLDEVAQWVLDNRNKVHHQFFSSDMTQFRRTGRVSGHRGHGAEHLPHHAAGRHRVYQGVQQGARQEEGRGGHGGHHGAARPGRQRLRRQVLRLSLRLPGGRPHDHPGHRRPLPQAEGQDPPVRHRHDHRLSRRPRHGSRLLPGR